MSKIYLLKWFFKFARPIFAVYIKTLHFVLEFNDYMPIIAGGAAAGGITMAIIVIVGVVMFRRYTSHGKLS